MSTLAELRDRSDALFTELLQAQTRRSPPVPEGERLIGLTSWAEAS